MEQKEDIYAKWLNGEINDSELEAQEGQEVLQELKQITQEVDQWAMPKYNAEAGYEKIKTTLQDKKTSSRVNKWLKFIAIIGLISLILFALLWYLGNQIEVLKADPGQKVNYALEDGSEVWLNNGSSVAYKSSEWSTERTITLQGEAFFDVNKGAPFTVNTPNGIITVLGTQFNVRTWGANLYVECYEGRVEVRKGDQSTVLTANEGVNIIAESMQNKQAIRNAAPLWRDGVSRFYDDKLTVVCYELERQYQIKIDLKATDRSFSGNFVHDDLEEAVRSICIPLNLKYTISKDKNSVVIE